MNDKRKVLWFTGIHSNAGKTRFICVECAAIAQNMHRETLTIHRKSVKLVKVFCHVAFVVYGIFWKIFEVEDGS